MRVSSATWPSFIGTLKSTRTSAVLADQSVSRMVHSRWVRGRGSGVSVTSCLTADRWRLAHQFCLLAPRAGVADDLAQDGAIRGFSAVQLARNERGDVRQPTRIAHLVVVPAQHLGQIADDERVQSAEDRRARVALEVRGDQRLLGIAEDAEHRVLRALAHGVVDLVLTDFAVEDGGEIDDRHGADRDAKGYATESAL